MAKTTKTAAVKPAAKKAAVKAPAKKAAAKAQSMAKPAVKKAAAPKRKAVTTRRRGDDPRVALLKRTGGASPFETRAAMGHKDGKATTYSGLAALAKRGGFKIKELPDNKKGEPMYRFVK